MLPTAHLRRGNKRRQQLLAAFDRLAADAQEQLIAFAEFLVDRTGPATVEEPAAPKPIPRPAQESVIAAVRRLSETYHMLDKGAMLHETSTLVSAHVLQGRPAQQVIDELENLFETRYHDYRDEPAG
jgi:hypothetical protein